MELKAKDTYRIESKDGLSIEDLESLWNPYLALSCANTIGLYCLLHTEKASGVSVETHGHLCELLDIRIETLQKSFRLLEQIGLIESYLRDNEDHQDFIYVLKKPLTLQNLLNHEALGRALYQKIGNTSFDQMKKRFARSVYDKDGFTQITAKFDPSALMRWDETAEAQYLTQQTRPQTVKLTHLTFDLKKFLQRCSSVVFPMEMRTQDTLEKIEELGSIFGISEDDMVRLVGKCVNFKSGKVDLEALHKRITHEPLHQTKLPDDPYRWPPVIFLKKKQNGIEPVDADKRLLLKLVGELRLNPEVVNVLVEHILATNNQRLNKAYVEKIAMTWSRLGIKSVEEAKKEIDSPQVSFKSAGTRKRNDVMPTFEEETQGLSEAERAELFESLNALGGKKHGKD